MKRIHLPPKILIGIIVLLGIITFGYDVVIFNLTEYGEPINFPILNYIHEAFSLLIVILFYLYLRTKPIFTETNVQKNLKNIIKLIAFIYIFIFICQQVFSPEFSTAQWPYAPETLFSLIYANFVSLAAILFLVPLLVIIKNLIYYKHKKRTTIYIIIACIFSLFNIVFTAIFKTRFEWTLSGVGAISTITLWINFILFLLIALRNNWITYLSRKEKRYYSLISIVIVGVIIPLFEYAFEEAVPAHSLALGAFTNLAWFFLVFYSILAGLNLLLHLPTARVFDRKMKEVSSLHNLSRAISVEFDFGKIVRMITDMSSEVIESSFTWLEIYDENTQKIYVAASKNLTESEISALNNKDNNEIRDQFFSKKQTILVNDLAKNKTYKAIKEWKSNIGSFTGVPLMSANGQVFGILFAAKSESFGFDPDDVNMLEAYANQAAIALENANLLKSSFEQERMEKELQIAREVQHRLLPQKIPEVKNIQIETLTITAYEVGGDYYDFYDYSNSNIGMVIGDVSGKGTSAAFYMAETKGIIQSLARSYYSPKDILINTNKILYASMEKKSFISLLAARIDLNSNILKFARAGHCPVIYYSAKKDCTEELRPDGIAVGLDEGMIFNQSLEECHKKLYKNDILAFYTDGLSEARNKYGDEFGEERLCEVIKTNAQLNVTQLKEVIIDNILRFLDGQNLHDDLTLVLIKI